MLLPVPPLLHAMEVNWSALGSEMVVVCGGQTGLTEANGVMEGTMSTCTSLETEAQP